MVSKKFLSAAKEQIPSVEWSDVAALRALNPTTNQLEPPKDGFWSVSPEETIVLRSDEQKRSRKFLVLACTSILTLSAALFWMSLQTHNHLISSYAIGVMLLCPSAISLVRPITTRKRKKSNSANAFRREWDVDLDVVVNGALTGSDSGVLWVYDGVLYFAGSYMSFALTGDLLMHRDVQVHSRPFRPYQRALQVPLKPHGTASEWHVQFDLTKSVNRTDDQSDIAYALRTVLDPPMRSSERQLPPLTRGPLFDSPAVFAFLAWSGIIQASVLAGGLIYFCFAAFFVHGGTVFIALPAACYVAGILCPSLKVSTKCWLGMRNSRL